MNDKLPIQDLDHPAGGWGSVKAVTSILVREHVALHGMRVLSKQNKPDGFACASCAWAKPAQPHPAEFCENGAKATAWEITSRRATPEFFASRTLAELETWPDHELEEAGRLTAPMRWDSATDKYVETTWDEAFATIGAELHRLDPKSVVFYCSGRASLESAYLYQLLARMYGCNNLPDSSNMCHESSSVALPKSIGVPVGTVQLEDFERTDCIITLGQNVGVSAPRLLHWLQDARKRGVPIVTFNPLREPGLLHFANPQSPREMLTPAETVISTQYHQLRAGGDTAALMGLCKWLIEMDDEAVREGGLRVLDADFISAHTKGFEAFAQTVRDSKWEDIERESGLQKAELAAAAAVYAKAEAAIVLYGMGVTQQINGVQNVNMIANLALLRGNVGKPGAGICAVRGHSNVQGQRTVGITEKPELAPLDKLAELYGFEPPREPGLDTIGACKGVLEGSVYAFIGLGGNFVRAVPDTRRMEAAWRRLRLTVQVATKLNRSHLIHGEVAYLLPCVGRVEIDRQAGGEQSLSIEDSTACIHGSKGMVEPASDKLLSEPAIITGFARAMLPPNTKVPWEEWVGDYALIRNAIEKTYPETFHDFNARMWTPGGFHRPLAACERIWKTESGKANFIVPERLAGAEPRGPDVLRLISLRSNDQFNTTVYGYEDRYRDVHGTRDVLFMNPEDMQRLGIEAEQQVTVLCDADDGRREVGGLRAKPYDIPQGCVAAYYPECNPLFPVGRHDARSKVPGYKALPVRLDPGPRA